MNGLPPIDFKIDFSPMRDRTPTMDKLVKVINNSDKFKFENAAKVLNDALTTRKEIMAQQTPIQIVHQGAININAAIIDHQTENIVCITVDFSTKYAEYNSHSSGDNCPPEVWYGASDETIKLNDDPDLTDELTGICFPDFVGWRVYCASSPGRYSAQVVLVKS